MKNIVIITLLLSLFIPFSCKDESGDLRTDDFDIPGSYMVLDSFNVVEPYMLFGSNSYKVAIDILDGELVMINNFQNEYTLTSLPIDQYNSFQIPNHTFVSFDSSKNVTISGNGRFANDSLYFNYHANNGHENIEGMVIGIRE